MKKVLAVLGIILLIIALLAGYVLYVNRGNIASLVTSLRYDRSEIEEQIARSNTDLKDGIQQYFDEGIREFTEEENEAIAKGEMSQSEALAKAIIEAPKKNGASADAIIAKYTSRLLAMQNKYIGLIEQILSDASAEYRKLPKEKLGHASKISIMQKHVGTINSLESTCDSEVEAVISKLKAELEAIGADTSVISVIRQAYENEKSLKKAYYIEEYGD